MSLSKRWLDDINDSQSYDDGMMPEEVWDADAGCNHQYTEQGGAQQCGVRCIKCGHFVGAWE